MPLKRFIPIAIAVFLIAGSYTAGEAGIRHINPRTTLPAPRPVDRPGQLSAFYKWNSRDIVKKFKDNGLEVRDIKPGYLLEPLLIMEATVFMIPSFGKNIGGYVSSYDSKTKMQRSKNYYMNMNKDRNVPAWWIFEIDNILLMISGHVPEDIARKYEKVLNE